MWLAAVITCGIIGQAAAQQRLWVVGGGERPPEATRRFVEWCGPRSRVLVVTWASGVPQESFEALNKNFTAASAVKTVHAPVRPLTAETRAKFITEMSEATCLFFSGGDQNRIMDVLADAELYNLIRDRYNSGMPIGGTSAGAAVLSDPMMTGMADLKVFDGAKVGVRKGLGLLPGVIFDQHFLVRQRHNRLFGLVFANPSYVGIGIDEDTSVLVEDNRNLTVMGKTQVLFVHSRKGRQPFELSILASGESFDLKKRRSIAK